jgi:hypothetical protein
MEKSEAERESEYRKNLEIYVTERTFDLAYLKLTAIIILLIIIIFCITCKFNAQNFTPYISAQKNNIFRSDPAFDNHSDQKFERMHGEPDGILMQSLSGNL